MARIDFVTGNAQRYLPDVEALATLPDRVEAALAGHSVEDLRTAPAEGEWPAGRIVGHMIAYARTLHAGLYRMAWMSDPVLEAWDEQAEAAREDWTNQDGARLLDALTEAITGAVDVLKELPDASWGRAGIHPQAGRFSIRQVARGQARHFDQHLEQLERALGG